MTTETSFTTPFPWTCPYCGRDTTIVSVTRDENSLWGGPWGPLYVTLYWFTCPNPECQGPQLTLQLHEATRAGVKIASEFIDEWTLIPRSKAKVFPDYIPQAIRNDYKEACLILQDSPKAAATLARRCLQGMIRDFWSVKGKPNLYQEIEAIKDRVDPEVLEAINAVRAIGNIGAHMEKDVDLIIEVEPHEAELLINLVERLIKEWYINREERQKMAAEVSKLAQEKQALAAPRQ